MKPKVISYIWPRKDNVSPHVIEVCHCILPQRVDSCRISYPNWVFDYDYDSDCYCRLEGQDDWRIRPARTAHLYPPGAVYYEKPRSETPLRHSAWFLFTGSLDDVLGPYVQEKGYAIFEDPDGLVGRQLYAAAQATSQHGKDAYWYVHAVLAEILAIITSAKHLQDETWILFPITMPDIAEKDFVKVVDDYLRTHLAEPITLDRLAEHLGVSNSTLSHRFRQATGSTPIATLIRKRVDVAKVLLRRGYSLRHIASHVGFCDEYHFSKTFKRITGMTPKQFRIAGPS